MPNPNHSIMSPFYERHAGRRPWQYTVKCETIKDMGFAIRNQLRFQTMEEQQIFMDMFCCSFDYVECPYYKAIYEKYNKRGKNERGGKERLKPV